MSPHILTGQAHPRFAESRGPCRRVPSRVCLQRGGSSWSDDCIQGPERLLVHIALLLCPKKSKPEYFRRKFQFAQRSGMDCHHRTNSTSMRSRKKAARCGQRWLIRTRPTFVSFLLYFFTLGIASFRLHDPDHGRLTAMWKVVEKISLASFLHDDGEDVTAL